MHFAAGRDRLERLTQSGGQIGHGLALDRESGADLRSVSGEHSEDHGAARSDRFPHRGEVALPILLLDEEVEHGPVVPELVRSIGLPLKEIRPDTPHGCVSGEPASCRLERGGRDVEHRYVGITARDELVGDERCPTADVDHSGIASHSQLVDEVERHARDGLVPAHTVHAVRRVGVIPVPASRARASVFDHGAI